MDFIHMNSILFHAISISNCNSVILNSLMIYRYTERCSNSILSTISSTYSIFFIINSTKLKIKKSKLENLKSNLTTFLENKNVNNKGTYINRLNAGEDISNLKREILGVINKKNAERKNYDLKLKELSVLLNSSKNLNNSMKAKFLRNFEKTRNFNKVRKNVEDEFKKINNARKQGEITFRNADQKKLLQKILNNSKNFTNDDKRMFMQRLEAGNNFNTLKGNAIQAARNLAKKRKNRELEQKMKAEAEYKEEQRRQQRKLLPVPSS